MSIQKVSILNRYIAVNYIPDHCLLRFKPSVKTS